MEQLTPLSQEDCEREASDAAYDAIDALLTLLVCDVQIMPERRLLSEETRDLVYKVRIALQEALKRSKNQ
ncbi:hypothetical protein HYW82_01435 [Candidatus Peregrinibacteria bacterium]|nr:hypothetical protein [Candidatus Peregrinibacteria bacterium]